MLRLIFSFCFIFSITACGGGSDSTSTDNFDSGVDVVVITPSASEFKTTISVSSNSFIADGISSVTITIQAIDLKGVNLTTGGDTLVLTTTLGTLSAITDNDNGTYSATLTSSNQQALSIITGTINGGLINDFVGVANRIDKTNADFITLATLGEKLFNDTNLSNPIGQSCASCHDDTSGFDDPDDGLATSEGALNATTFGQRNAQTVSYVAHIPQQQIIAKGLPVLIGGQFWDGRASTLEDQAKLPFLNSLEMNNTDNAAVINKIKNAVYKTEFETVLLSGASLDTADVDIAYDKMAQAIAAFLRTETLSPFTSKFDDVQKGAAIFNDSELRGQDIFHNKAQCARCHSTPEDLGEQVFSNFEYFNIGSPTNPTSPFIINTDSSFIDNGLGEITGDSRDNGKFRVPSLRNIADTAPYMHNGALSTLRDVIDFYSGDLGAVQTEVNENLADGGQYLGFGLTPVEKNDLEAFLNTLSDQ